MPIEHRGPGDLGDIDAREDLGRFGDAGQTLRQRLRRQVIQVQVDVVLVDLVDLVDPRWCPSSSEFTRSGGAFISTTFHVWVDEWG